VDSPSGRGVFIPECGKERVEALAVQIGYFAREGESLHLAKRGSLLSVGNREVFVEYPVSVYKGGVNLYYHPMLLARWLKRGYHLDRVSEMYSVMLLSDFENLVDVAIEAQKQGDVVTPFYECDDGRWYQVGNIGVLDRAVLLRHTWHSGYAATASGGRVPRCRFRSLEARRKKGISGPSLSREDVVETIAGILVMTEPKSRGFMNVIIPEDLSKEPRFSYDCGMRPQPVAARLITDFLKAGKVQGVAFDGTCAEITFNLSDGIKLTPVERAHYIGQAVERLRLLGIDLPFTAKAA
jgi:hypothetical protein